MVRPATGGHEGERGEERRDDRRRDIVSELQKRLALRPAGCLFLLLLTPSARLQATPLNLTTGLPDFMTSSLNVRFVPGSNIFSAVGVTSAYERGSVPLVGPGTFSLTAFINDAGVLNGGFLTIAGNIGGKFGMADIGQAYHASAHPFYKSREYHSIHFERLWKDDLLCQPYSWASKAPRSTIVIQ